MLLLKRNSTLDRIHLFSDKNDLVRVNEETLFSTL